jgi:pilus assembly protein CpaF
MPVIKTHHRFLIKDEREKYFDRNNSDINILVSNITFDILRDSPGLVADVASGAADRSVLETAIVKDIDKNKYHCGLFREELIRKVFDFMFGYGELQQYIEDEDITDIDGTRYNEFIIKRNGIREKVNINFGSEKIFDTYCKLIAIRNGGILNENDSHCRVTDEKNRLRINVSIRPRNISGPAISIRKHRKKSYSLYDLEQKGMINEEILIFLRKLAKTDATILFCGKGAAGKTTLMRAFVNELPLMERVLIAESDAEIYPDKPYCIEQKIKKQNEGGRPVTLGDLVRDGLTMSLDTYCIGEIIGSEAWEYVRASFTGHRGIATIHSESADDTFGRLLTLSKSANTGESETTIKEMMAKSIDVIFYLKSFKVIDVLEVECYDRKRDEFSYNRLFSYRIQSEDENGILKGKFIKQAQIGKRLGKKFAGRIREPV